MISLLEKWLLTTNGCSIDEKIVGATIHLDHLSKDKALEVLKIIHTYDENLEIKTKASANAGVVSNVLI